MHICSIQGCPRKHYALGLCRFHWQKFHEGKLKITRDATLNERPTGTIIKYGNVWWIKCKTGWMLLSRYVAAIHIGRDIYPNERVFVLDPRKGPCDPDNLLVKEMGVRRVEGCKICGSIARVVLPSLYDPNIRHVCGECFGKGLGRPRGDKHWKTIISDKIVTEMRQLRAQGIQLDEIVKRYGYSRSAIKKAVHGESHKHLHLPKYPPPIKHHIGHANGNSKLTERDVREIHRRISTGEKTKFVCEDYGINVCFVGDLNRGRVWSHLGLPLLSSRGKRRKIR